MSLELQRAQTEIMRFYALLGLEHDSGVCFPFCDKLEKQAREAIAAFKAFEKSGQFDRANQLHFGLEYAHLMIECKIDNNDFEEMVWGGGIDRVLYRRWEKVFKSMKANF